MRPSRPRAAAPVHAVLLMVLALLAAPTAATAAVPPAADEVVAHTVLVGAPGLAWSDITEETTPWLTVLAESPDIRAVEGIGPG